MHKSGFVMTQVAADIRAFADADGVGAAIIVTIIIVITLCVSVVNFG